MFQMLELGSTGRGRVSQVSPASEERCTAPILPMAVSPTAAKSTLGVVGLESDAPAVGQDELVGGDHGLPALAHVGGGIDLAGRAGQHLARVSGGDGHPVNVRMNAALDVSPGVATVEAAIHAIHLDPGPYRAAVLGVHHQHGHHGRADMALLGHLHRQLGPAMATVLGPEEGGGLDPTKMLSVFWGSMAMDQMGMPSMGDQSFSHVAPLSSVR